MANRFNIRRECGVSGRAVPIVVVKRGIIETNQMWQVVSRGVQLINQMINSDRFASPASPALGSRVEPRGEVLWRVRGGPGGVLRGLGAFH